MRRSMVVLALSTALFAAACSRDEAGPAGAPPGGGMPPPEVGVVVVQPQDVPVARELVGRLSSFRSADVRARVPGVLQRRLYEEGSNVRKGQPLFQIDPAQLHATENGRAWMRLLFEKPLKEFLEIREAPFRELDEGGGG